MCLDYIIPRTHSAYKFLYFLFNTLYFKRSLNYRVEMVEIMDERFGKHSFERVRYVINNLLGGRCEPHTGVFNRDFA